MLKHKTISMSLGALALFGLCLGIAGSAHAANALRYVSDAAIGGKDAVILDTRSADICETRSLAGARCLPAEDFLGLHERLAGFANIAWVLGSAGLTGTEHVLVVGGNPVKRDFVAGLLYLMGQSDISVLTQAVKTLKGPLGAGEARDMLRTKIWQAPARTGALVFRNELRDLLASGAKPVLLDGRSEKAFWGEVIDAARGGHLPGADHYPAIELRAGIASGQTLGPVHKNAIVYGRGTVDGIAYLTMIMAGTGAKVRVFPGGWAEWASDGALPADAETHPLRAGTPPAQGIAAQSWSALAVSGGIGIFVGGALVLAGVWALGRKKAG